VNGVLKLYSYERLIIQHMDNERSIISRTICSHNEERDNASDEPTVVRYWMR
jgi:hypothetical protein